MQSKEILNIMNAYVCFSKDGITIPMLKTNIEFRTKRQLIYAIKKSQTKDNLRRFYGDGKIDIIVSNSDTIFYKRHVIV